MRRAKISSERQKKIGSWGGRRNDAGRKREFGLSDRRDLAGDYFARMQESREFGDTLRRDDVISELMAKYKVTQRMVVRCVAEFLPHIRWNAKVYKYAIEGAEIQPLSARNINKLKPGVYREKKL